MNNEIKEILDDLLFTTTLPNVSIKLNKEKINQLKDYITNLQERIEKLEEQNKLTSEERKWVIKLAKEIEIDNKYKSRNEKAIEYINEHQRKDEFLNLNEWQTRDLLNILNGGDDNG